MAYGSSRRRREYEPEIRDVLEDAARDAGMSVADFLDQAVNAHEDDASRRRRPPARRPLRLVEDDASPLDSLERRITYQGRQQDEMSEDRVARILGRAFSEIRASEERTAALIESMARPQPANERVAERTPPGSVAEILASAERRASRDQNVVPLNRTPAAQAPQRLDEALAGMNGVVSRLQASVMRQEVENALKLLEKKLTLVQPQSTRDELMLQGMAAEISSIRAIALADGAEVPIAAIEGPIRSLTERISALIATPARDLRSGHASEITALDRKLDDVAGATAAMIGGIQDELVRLGQSGIHNNEPQLAASFNRLENRIHQLEHASREPLDQIRHQLDAFGRATAAGGGQTAGLRDSIVQLEQKFDRLTGRIAQPLQMVHNAITQLTRQQAATKPDGQLNALFSELADLKRGMGGQSNAALHQQLSTISERIEAIGTRMQDMQTPPARDLRRKPIDEEIAELKALITAAKSPCDDTKVLEAIAHLERKIAALENSPQALMERLDRLQAKLEEAPQGGGVAQPLPQNIELLLRNLAMRLEAPQHGVPVDDAGLDRLHDEIRLLSSKLEQMPQAHALAPATQDISAVERGISDLFRQIDGLKTEVGNTAARAAAEAVRGMQPPAALASFDPPLKADTSLLEASISQLRQSQSEAEQRTTRTLEALHDTLHRVVDRLGSMEREVRAPEPIPAAPSFAGFAEAIAPHMPLVATQAPVHAPAPRMAQPSQAQAAVWQNGPVLQPRAPAPAHDDALNLLPPDMLAPEPTRVAMAAQALSPAVESSAPRPFSETLASLRAGRTSAPAAPEPKPEPKSAIASAFAAARNAMANLKTTKPETDAPALATTTRAEPALQQAAAAAVPHTASSELDLPLEPGSGRPRPGAARLQQTANSPQGLAASQGLVASQGPTGDPKADFLAAARRAAQAAAQQSAEVLAEADPRARRKGKVDVAAAALAAGETAPKSNGFRAKHAILLGLAALIVAAGAGYQFMGGVNRAEAPAVAQPPPRTSSLTPQQLAQPQQTASLQARQPDAPPPRQILPPALSPEPQRQVAAREVPLSLAPPPGPQAAAVVTPPTARVDEPVTVGSIAPPARVPSFVPPPISPDDPLLRFEGLRDAPKLKEAARRGDASAFVEIGMRYAEGRGAIRDHKTAALWFERAAEFGSAPAQYRLGTMHREGRGVERNPKVALKHFQSSAEAGNARSMHNTAVLLAEGVNGAPDYASAGEWFKKAAEYGIRDSQYNLAILYARGLGVGQDLMASYAWFSAAAAGGDEDAAKKRDEVGGRMSPERLQQARTAASAWKPKTPDPMANELNAPAGGWDAEAKQVPAGANTLKATPKRG